MPKTPFIPDINTIVSAGINPKTGLPYRLGVDGEYKAGIQKVLRVIDEQDAITRFEWNDLPHNIDGDLLERVLYYRGQGMFFYLEASDEYYFLPYALDGTINVVGRYNTVTPLPFNGVNKDEKKKDAPWIQGLKFDVLYDIPKEGEDTEKLKKTHCVLLSDYSKQISQTTIPRQALNDTIIDIESDLIPFMRTALQHQTGTEGVRTRSDDEAYNVTMANATLRRAALQGDRYVGIRGELEFQELASGTLGLASDYMMALESLENFRLGTYGIQAGGIFQKKAHMLQTEQDAAGGSPGLVMENCLRLRLKFCEIVNKVFGLNISVRPTQQDTMDYGDEENEDVRATRSQYRQYLGAKLERIKEQNQK